ncbi:MAG: class I SAM-dependent methyltransferase [Clostridiales bacterium]|nr:class I SAM-dependent methyltransferase [Clostridiales bacterium]
MNDHYFTSNPTSEIKEKTFSQTINNVTLTFTTVSGVFSFDERVDRASELLIRNFSPSGKAILDLGCGYGPIGLFIKSFHPELTVSMGDVNNRAVEYSMRNAVKNGLEVQVLTSDLYSGFVGSHFSDIVTNPPIAAGKKLNQTLIHEAFDYLEPTGALWLVAFHNKGGSTLKNMMMERFGNVEDIEKSGGIRVYKSVRI